MNYAFLKSHCKKPHHWQEQLKAKYTEIWSDWSTASSDNSSKQIYFRRIYVVFSSSLSTLIISGWSSNDLMTNLHYFTPSSLSRMHFEDGQYQLPPFLALAFSLPNSIKNYTLQISLITTVSHTLWQTGKNQHIIFLLLISTLLTWIIPCSVA